MKAWQLLTKAKELIQDPKNWIKGTLAANAKGVHVAVGSRSACCFCALGALTRAAQRQSGLTKFRAGNVLSTAACELGAGASVTSFNDRKRTTHADIMKLYDKAIALAMENEK